MMQNLRTRRPPCFPEAPAHAPGFERRQKADRWVLWLRAAQAAPELLTPSSYCADCTPEYQARMKREQRCQHPDTEFHIDENGFLEGVRP